MAHKYEFRTADGAVCSRHRPEYLCEHCKASLAALRGTDATFRRSGAGSVCGTARRLRAAMARVTPNGAFDAQWKEDASPRCRRRCRADRST